MTLTDQTAKGPVERLLSPLAAVRRGEAASVLLMSLTMFLILAAYYMLKTARVAPEEPVTSTQPSRMRA